MKLPEKLIDMIEDADFSVHEVDGNIIEFGKYSSMGQDFNFCVDTEESLEYFLNNVLACYQDFDVSYEAYLWLDNTGHGKNGAPYKMIDVYRDMEECQEYIMELYHIVDTYCEEEE